MRQHRFLASLLLFSLLQSSVNGWSQSKNVILGLAGGVLPPDSTKIGLRPFNIRVFLGSLRLAGSSARVVLFSGEENDELRSMLEEFGAELEIYDAVAFNKTDGPFANHRYRLFREYLEAHEGEFENVMLTDVRDLMFQGDPFDSIPVNGGLAVAIESLHTTIETCFWHKVWFTAQCLPYIMENAFGKMRHFPRSCSGTTLGTVSAVIKYIELMEKEMRRAYNVRDDYWCIDQASHNYLLWTGELEKHMSVTQYGAENTHLCTFGDYKLYNMTEGDEEVLNQAGFAPAVVHQFDRSPHLVLQMYSKFGDGDFVVAELCAKHPIPLTGGEPTYLTQSWKKGECYNIHLGKKPSEKQGKEEL